MRLTVFLKNNLSSFLVVAAVMMGVLHPAFSQRVTKSSKDTVKTVANDTLLPTLVMKVASYTSTIDHTDFLIKRKFNVTPITSDLPEIERKVKGFKTRLETRGSRMNLRSLNSSVIMLNEITDKLKAYH